MISHCYDFSKVKTFNLDDLIGRTIFIKCFRDSSEGLQMLMAFDIDNHESFLISIENLPILGGEQ